MPYRFTSQEKLKSQKLIDALFEDGQSIKAFPMLIVIKPVEKMDVVFKAGFSVSKRRFKKAVDRNLLKRKMREAFRLHKSKVEGELSSSYILMFVYIGKEAFTSELISNAMEKGLQKIKNLHKDNL